MGASYGTSFSFLQALTQKPQPTHFVVSTRKARRTLSSPIAAFTCAGLRNLKAEIGKEAATVPLIVFFKKFLREQFITFAPDQDYVGYGIRYTLNQYYAHSDQYQANLLFDCLGMGVLSDIADKGPLICLSQGLQDLLDG